jgi:hypothetical protein
LEVREIPRPPMRQSEIPAIAGCFAHFPEQEEARHKFSPHALTFLRMTTNSSVIEDQFQPA